MEPNNTTPQNPVPQQPTQSVQPSAPLTPIAPTEPKSHTLLIAVTSILVLMVAGWGIHIYLNSSLCCVANDPSAIPTIDDTADWKTYRNDLYGYEFKYPSDWTLADGKDIGISDMFNYVRIRKSLKNNEYAEISFDSSKEKLDSSGQLVSTTTLDGVEWTNTRFNDGAPGQQAPHDSIFMQTTMNGRNYSISIYPEPIDELSNKILSTFKFIDETAHWKTIATDQFAISFPEGYERKEVSGKGGPILYLEYSSNSKRNIAIYTEQVVSENCFEGLCGKKADYKLTTSLNWDVIKGFTYCDVGVCEKRDSVYRSIMGSTRFYILINGEMGSDQIAETFVPAG